jgi:hypothetical protein
LRGSLPLHLGQDLPELEVLSFDTIGGILQCFIPIRLVPRFGRGEGVFKPRLRHTSFSTKQNISAPFLSRSSEMGL